MDARLPTGLVTKKEEVLRLVERLQGPLRLGDWALDVQFVPLGHRADCEAKPEYREALLRFDLRKIRREELFAYVLHEMLHCHVWKLAAVGERYARDPKDREAVNWEEEALTTELERILTPLLAPTD